MIRIHALLADDEAVSPVIGVILMVAITVILAAVIATFVLGLGDQVSSTAPQASLSFDYNESGDGANASKSLGDDGTLTITHSGGQSIAEARLNATDDDGDGPVSLYGSDEDTMVTAGKSETVGIDDNDRVSVVWESDSGSNSATLGVFEGPQA